MSRSLAGFVAASVMAVSAVAANAAPVATASTQSALVSPTTSQQAKRYKNCKALNKVYPHGVGRKGAKDKTKSKPVRNFRVDNAAYLKNRHLDRDRDGISCEKH